jgi:hypothetical protein
MERRIASTEVRASAAGKELRISGYAACYGVLSGDLGGFKERLAKRSFDRVLSTKPDVVALLNHDSNNVLGRTTSGTLKLNGDDKGLEFSCLLPNTQAGRDTHESVRRGDLSGCSFAFNCDERSDGSCRDAWDDEEDEIEDEKELGLRSRQGNRKRVVVRTINDFSRLLDVSVVTYPAYSKTSVDARNINVVAAEVRSRIEALRAPRPHSFYKRTHDTAIRLAEQTIVARRKDLTNFLLS